MMASKDDALHATPAMCYHCFDTLIDSLQNQTQHNKASNRMPTSKVPSFAKDLKDVSIECPLFVTWDKQAMSSSSPPKYQLRGCIGTLSPRLLVPSVGEYALISALNDRRFRSIRLDEVSQLRVSVSLLVRYEPCQHLEDWSIGTHGLLIKFRVQGQDYSATYLPEVAKEQGWTKEYTLTTLIQKAGYHQKITPEVLSKLVMTRYQSSKCRATFADYFQHHKSQQQQRPNDDEGRAAMARDLLLSSLSSSAKKSQSWTPCNNL